MNTENTITTETENGTEKQSKSPTVGAERDFCDTVRDDIPTFAQKEDETGSPTTTERGKRAKNQPSSPNRAEAQRSGFGSAKEERGRGCGAGARQRGCEMERARSDAAQPDAASSSPNRAEAQRSGFGSVKEERGSGYGAGARQRGCAAEQARSDAGIFHRIATEAPSPRQREFFECAAANVAYGGARGGGKSWAMRRKLVLLAMRYPGLKLLLLRRTLPELRHNHILPLQQELAGYARYVGDERAFLFPNGARLVMGYCDSDSDCAQYQGQEYDVIGFEEATNFQPDWIVFIATCLRTVRTDFTPRIYYTCNPGGPGHSYIKRLFIDREFRNGESPKDYVFIPAKVYDNRVLMERDPGYIKRLEALPPQRRRAHLEGVWDIYEGQVFEEFRNDPAHYLDRRWTHVIAPFEVPDTWRVYRSFDFGYAKPFSCGWWAVDYDKRLYRILELYGCVQGEPDTGVRWAPEHIFRKIREIESTHRWLRGRQIHGVADPAIWDASRGDSIADIADRCGVWFEPGDHKRLPGWMQLHYRLAFDDGGVPMLYVFENCRDTIRTLPLLRYDPNSPEDVDTRQEDHIADEIRYLCQYDPIAPRLAAPRTPAVFDPLASGGVGRYAENRFL